MFTPLYYNFISLCLHFCNTSFDTCGLVNFLFCFVCFVVVVVVLWFLCVCVVVVVVFCVFCMCVCVCFLGGHPILFACLSVDGHLCIYLVSLCLLFLNMLYSTICVFITANNNRSFL